MSSFSIYFMAPRGPISFLCCNVLLVSQLQSFSCTRDQFVVKFKVITLVADLPAKADCLRMVQFNGYHSCPWCTIPGEYSRCYKKMLFPLPEEEWEPRTESEFRRHGSLAEVLHHSQSGVKGVSPLSIVSCSSQKSCLILHALAFSRSRSHFHLLLCKS